MMPGKFSLAAVALASVLFGTVAQAASAPAEPVTPVFSLTPDRSAPGTTPRRVLVDAAPFTGRSDAEQVVYDLDAVLRPVSVRGLRSLPDWAVGVRLVLSEVGADRVVQSRYGLLEAIGVLETVTNRMDPLAYNPATIKGYRTFKGCGGGDFAACADPNQYYGLRTARALNPSSAYSERLLLEAIDVVVQAWWMHDTHIVSDVTRGATSFRHPDGPFGAIVFSGPRTWVRGHYELSVSRRIAYNEAGDGLAGVRPGDYYRYLWGEPTHGWTARDFSTPEAELEQVWADGVVSDRLDSDDDRR